MTSGGAEVVMRELVVADLAALREAAAGLGDEPVAVRVRETPEGWKDLVVERRPPEAGGEREPGVWWVRGGDAMGQWGVWLVPPGRRGWPSVREALADVGRDEEWETPDSGTMDVAVED